MTVVEGRQILRRSAAGPRRIATPMPILTCDRALLVGIGVDQARNRKTFATHRAGRNARPGDPLEHTTETSSSPKRSLRARESAE